MVESGPSARPTAFLCVTCGTQFAPAPTQPPDCPICLDERQYVGYGGQEWTTPEELRETHAARLKEVEPGLVGIGVEPSFGIGQRALLVENLLWDSVALVDDDIAAAVDARGGLDLIAISHPHFYTAMVDWADRFDARVLLHDADREWVMRPSQHIEHWSGDRLRLSPDLELIRLGGHFPGGTVCLWRAGAGGRGALLSSDIVHIVADRDRVTFMWSYPNMIPLPGSEVARIGRVVETLEFDRIYGGWWETVVACDAKAKVLRSVRRYLDAVAGGTL